MSRIASVSFAALMAASSLQAQIGGSGADGALRPTANSNFDVNPKQGRYEFTEIDIPPDVRLWLKGNHPVVFRVQGRVRIAGTLSADGEAGAIPTGGVGGPGGYAGGDGGAGLGLPGQGPAGGKGGERQLGGVVPPDPGGHATPGLFWMFPRTTTYGSALPFDLRGGSGSGGWAGTSPWGGAGGGGTLVILADGPIEVSGSVRAKSTGIGGAGSILLRSMRSCTVSGRVDAEGVLAEGGVQRGGDGFVRLDVYAAQPSVTGTVVPTPLVLELPHLREANAPRRGGTWTLECVTVPGDDVVFVVGVASASIPVPPLGTLLIDPTRPFAVLGHALAPVNSHDPIATLTVPVANDPSFLGVVLYAQAVNAVTAAPPRLSNSVRTTVQ